MEAHHPASALPQALAASRRPVISRTAEERLPATEDPPGAGSRALPVSKSLPAAESPPLGPLSPALDQVSQVGHRRLLEHISLHHLLIPVGPKVVTSHPQVEAISQEALSHQEVNLRLSQALGLDLLPDAPELVLVVASQAGALLDQDHTILPLVNRPAEVLVDHPEAE